MSVKEVKAAVMSNAGKINVRSFPYPEISDDIALIQIEISGILCTRVKLCVVWESQEE